MSKLNKKVLYIAAAAIIVGSLAIYFFGPNLPIGARTFSIWKRTSTSISYDRGSVTVGQTPSTTNDLIVNETLRLVPGGTATTTCDTGRAGAMMYSTGTTALYYCNGSAWALFSTP